MSTIAIRDGLVAADTSVIRGGSIQRDAGFEKIRRIEPDGTVAGAVGTATFTAAFLKWAQASYMAQWAPNAPAPAEEGDVGFIAQLDGSVMIWDTPLGTPHVLRLPYLSFGSGRTEALGAMHAGADAVRAIDAACAHDPHTGGAVRSLRVGVAPAGGTVWPKFGDKRAPPPEAVLDELLGHALFLTETVAEGESAERWYQLGDARRDGYINHAKRLLARLDKIGFAIVRKSDLGWPHP